MKAILIDLDKTLIHDEDVKEHLVEFICNELNIDEQKSENIIDSFFKIQLTQTHYINSSSKVAVWKKVFKEHEIPYTPTLLHEVNNIFWEIVSGYIQPYVGVIETLAVLKHKGYILAVVSGGDYITRYLQIENSGILRFLDCVVTSEESGHKKSERDLYWFAKDELGVEVGDCIVIGDNEHDDIIMPKQDGFKTVKVGSMNEETVADFHIGGFQEIVNVLEKLEQGTGN